jgi:hypothetical protein
MQGTNDVHPDPLQRKPINRNDDLIAWGTKIITDQRINEEIHGSVVWVTLTNETDYCDHIHS